MQYQLHCCYMFSSLYFSCTLSIVVQALPTMGILRRRSFVPPGLRLLYVNNMNTTEPLTNFRSLGKCVFCSQRNKQYSLSHMSFIFCTLLSVSLCFSCPLQFMYLLLHTVKGTPFETPDQGKARLLTHWEQMDYGVQFTASRKFLTITPIVL